MIVIDTNANPYDLFVLFHQIFDIDVNITDARESVRIFLNKASLLSNCAFRMSDKEIMKELREDYQKYSKENINAPTSHT